MDPYFTLILPATFEGLEINIHNQTGFGDLRAQQGRTYWDETKKKWIVNVYLKPDDFLKLRPSA